MNIQELRNRLEQQKGQRNQLMSHLRTLRGNLVSLRRDLHRHELAREVIREVGLKTQQQLQFHISDIASLALEAVFPDPYQLKVNFVQRRNKTECDLLFIREENEIDPLEASGLGVVDITSFSLRIAAWSMLHPRIRNVIILDEPFRFVSENYQERASTMIKEVSDKLGIQFIINTHVETLATSADRVFEIGKKRNKSYIK